MTSDALLLKCSPEKGRRAVSQTRRADLLDGDAELRFDYPTQLILTGKRRCSRRGALGRSLLSVQEENVFARLGPIGPASRAFLLNGIVAVHMQQFRLTC